MPDVVVNIVVPRVLPDQARYSEPLKAWAKRETQRRITDQAVAWREEMRKTYQADANVTVVLDGERDGHDVRVEVPQVSKTRVGTLAKEKMPDIVLHAIDAVRREAEGMQSIEGEPAKRQLHVTEKTDGHAKIYTFRLDRLPKRYAMDLKDRGWIIEPTRGSLDYVDAYAAGLSEEKRGQVMDWLAETGYI